MKKLLGILALMAVAVFAVNDAVAQEVKSMKIDEVLTDGEQYVGKDIAVEGLCTHICSHGGRKMFLRGKKGLLRIQSSKETGAFSADVVNEPVQVVGILCETRIDETYLKNWEDRIKNGNKVGEHGGCETESAARGDQGNTDQQKIDNFRKRIAERSAAEGKNYLSVFYMNAKSYKIL